MNAVFTLQLVEAFNQRVVRSAVRDDPDVVACIAHHLRLGNYGACVLKLVPQAVEIVLVVVRTLAVLGVLVMPTAASEPCTLGMVDARQRAVADAVAIHVFVASKSPDSIEVFLA